MALDATGRNSLYKIHISLGKIVNSLNEKEKENGPEKARAGRKSSVTPSVLGADEDAGEEETTVLERTPEVEAEVVETIKEEEEEEDTILAVAAGSGIGSKHGSLGGNAKRRETSDSLVEELLSDDGDVDMSGM